MCFSGGPDWATETETMQNEKESEADRELMLLGSRADCFMATQGGKYLQPAHNEPKESILTFSVAIAEFARSSQSLDLFISHLASAVTAWVHLLQPWPLSIMEGLSEPRERSLSFTGLVTVRETRPPAARCKHRLCQSSNQAVLAQVQASSTP